MNRKRILIIEDELIHGVFLKSSIENCGYSVIDIISKGEDAINIAIQEKPDLIISDILLKARRRHTRWYEVTGVQTCALPI